MLDSREVVGQHNHGWMKQFEALIKYRLSWRDVAVQEAEELRSR